MRLSPSIVLAAALTLAACGGGAPPAPEAPAPVPPPPFTYAPVQLPPPVVPPTETAPTRPPILVCVLRDGRAENVEVSYDPVSGDTLLGGRPFREAHPAVPPYAAAVDWYVNNEPVRIGEGNAKVKYGLPRVLGAHEVERAGEYHGVPYFREAGTTGPLDVVYIFVRPGCLFQPYQVDYVVGGVRGR